MHVGISYAEDHSNVCASTLHNGHLHPSKSTQFVPAPEKCVNSEQISIKDKINSTSAKRTWISRLLIRQKMMTSMAMVVGVISATSPQPSFAAISVQNNITLLSALKLHIKMEYDRNFFWDVLPSWERSNEEKRVLSKVGALFMIQVIILLNTPITRPQIWVIF